MISPIEIGILTFLFYTFIGWPVVKLVGAVISTPTKED